jgi:peptidoglycan hydrolase-like protein with peptidoglycan-binding domain
VPGADVLNTDTPKCEAVAFVQEMLIGLGYDLGKYGADGEFGDCTELAVMQFQRDHGLENDGEYGPITRKMLTSRITEVINTATVKKGKWNVRTGPGREYPSAGVVSGGDKLPLVESMDWINVEVNGQPVWISKSALLEW